LEVLPPLYAVKTSTFLMRVVKKRQNNFFGRKVPIREKKQMKVYISADIEGITGTSHWNETEKKEADYAEFREQMTAEVAAACEGALEGGASEIWVKDAHDSARNLITTRLPQEVKLVRGWSGHPYMMVQGLDSSFGALMMVGYHSRAGSGENPLAHTMTGALTYIKINGQFTSEFLINAYTAALEKVPVVLVTGDAGLCAEAAGQVPGLTGVAVKQGSGDSTVNLHPQLAVQQIRTAARAALRGDLSTRQAALPERFSVEIRYRNHARAYGASFYPGARLSDPHTLQFETANYFDVLRLFAFVF
jgi:D-amino peptidase